jgi:tetratricopeptide (TPR) repeat protein
LAFDKKILIQLICLFILSCSTQKDKYINRQYHSINTKYNVLFNGENAFFVGKEILSKTFEDNFYETLPIEPISINGENVNETTVIPGFAKAEDKAVKAIQKHSMNIDGSQRNKEIDRAYLLLGKSRYFDRRFFPALEAFNFLLENHVDEKTYVEARIWREKTNIRLKNVELAIKNLSPLARNLSPKSKFYSQANASVANAFIQTKKIDSALFYLKRSLKTTKNNPKKARYLFIIGQLYEELNLPDSSLLTFEKLIKLNRRAPRKYLINAQIKELNLNWEARGHSPANRLTKLSNDYDNKNFKHWIYRALGDYYFKTNNDSLTVYFLNLSLNSKNIEYPTKERNYRDLADFYFNRGKYILSGKYLDSLIRILPDFTYESKIAAREKDNLKSVIKYERTAKSTDSVLYILSLSREKQIEFFRNQILKKQAKELTMISQEKKRFKLFSKNQSPEKFYFYNPSLLIQGEQKFLSIWGNRSNVDNWRVSSIPKPFDSTVSFNDGSEGLNNKAKIETPNNYINKLPSSIREIDSIKNLNFNSYFQLGMIYKESFKNLKAANTKLSLLLSKNPPKDIEAPTLYHLFKINQKLDSSLSSVYRERILNDFKGTAFEKILNSPDILKTAKGEGPQTIYKDLLELYKKGQLIKFLALSEKNEILFSGSQIEPKYNLLKVNVMGKLDGIKIWGEELNKFKTKYPETSEANQAKKIIKKLKELELAEKGKVYKNYKWILPYRMEDSLKLIDSQKKLQKIFHDEKEITEKWFFSKDLYNREYNFLVVHGILNIDLLNEFQEKLSEKYGYQVSTNNFVALSSQYREIIKNKTWNYAKD